MGVDIMQAVARPSHGLNTGSTARVHHRALSSHLHNGRTKTREGLRLVALCEPLQLTVPQLSWV